MEPRYRNYHIFLASIFGFYLTILFVVAEVGEFGALIAAATTTTLLFWVTHHIAQSISDYFLKEQVKKTIKTLEDKEKNND